MIIARECGDCSKYYRIDYKTQSSMQCPYCKREKKEFSPNTNIFSQCIFCAGTKFYRQKDFNQLIGCLIVLTGAILVPYTYGISLPILILVDWILYSRVSNMIVCYKCKTEFKNTGVIPESITNFDHHTAELYET